MINSEYFKKILICVSVCVPTNVCAFMFLCIGGVVHYIKKICWGDFFLS